MNDKYDMGVYENFMRIVCEHGKHDFVVVTQTTTNNAPEPINESHSWLQCKQCGVTIAIPSQQPLTQPKKARISGLNK